MRTRSVQPIDKGAVFLPLSGHSMSHAIPIQPHGSPLMVFALLLLALQQPAPDSALRGVRDPAFARDGRLVVSVDGDLYVQAAGGGAWIRLTSGPAWDREPAWSRDGTSIVFSSDRSGGFDLWRLAVPVSGAGSAPTDPERLTTSPEPDGEPSAGDDGRIIFVRGRGPMARLWSRA